jgi:hypothetical protein
LAIGEANRKQRPGHAILAHDDAAYPATARLAAADRPGGDGLAVAVGHSGCERFDVTPSQLDIWNEGQRRQKASGEIASNLCLAIDFHFLFAAQAPPVDDANVRTIAHGEIGSTDQRTIVRFERDVWTGASADTTGVHFDGRGSGLDQPEASRLDLNAPPALDANR